MSKFHINKHGVPAPCRAKSGNCPLGGDSGNEDHYDSKEEAQAAADKTNEEKYSQLPGMDKLGESYSEDYGDSSDKLPHSQLPGMDKLGKHTMKTMVSHQINSLVWRI